MPYQSPLGKTQTTSAPSQSSSILGGLLGGAVGLLAGVATGNPALGFGIGSSVGGAIGSLDTDTMTYQSAGVPYAQASAVDLSQYALNPFPGESPEEYHDRISGIFKVRSEEAARSFYV